MAPESAQVQGRPPGLTTGDLIDRLIQFDGPPQEFLVNLLAVQCRLSAAGGGAILRAEPETGVGVLAVFPPLPPNSTAPAWLAHAVELAPRALAEGATSTHPLREPDEMYGQPARNHLVMIPLRAGGAVRGLAVFVFETRDPSVLAACRERLELTVSLLSLYEMRLTLQRRQGDLRRLRTAQEVLAAVNEYDRFAAAAMALVNEVASRWQGDRVTLGFLKGRYVKLKAMSHTEKFSRKMQIVQDIEAAMEECLDQDVEIAYPAAPDATYVHRSTAELAKRHGPTAVLSMPLRKTGEPLAVLTVERPAETPLDLDEVEALRLACELSTPRLAALHESDRWFGARLAAGARKALAWLVGPKHTWIKLAAAAVTTAVVLAVTLKGEYQIEAPFTLQTVEHRVVPAPFEGYLSDVLVEPAQKVTAGSEPTVLARLHVEELQSHLDSALADQRGYELQATASEGQGKIDEAAVARAQAAQAAARVELLQWKISKATITAPIDGTVTRIANDLERRIGGPVQAGEVLVEIAPLESLRAELEISEDDIAELREGQTGQLAHPGHPEQRGNFTVLHINPMAESVEGKNVYRVRVRLDGKLDWMKPGMRGVSRVDVDRRTYAWLWTHRLTRWVRMKLWI